MRFRGSALVVGLALVAAGCAGSTSAYPSPDGRFSVEVTKDTHLAEPVWRVVVQVGVAGTVGDWTVGCLTPDDPPTTVTWSGPLTFRLGTTRGQDAVVQLQASGEPGSVTQPAQALGECSARS